MVVFARIENVPSFYYWFFFLCWFAFAFIPPGPIRRPNAIYADKRLHFGALDVRANKITLFARNDKPLLPPGTHIINIIARKNIRWKKQAGDGINRRTVTGARQFLRSRTWDRDLPHFRFGTPFIIQLSALGQVHPCTRCPDLKPWTCTRVRLLYVCSPEARVLHACIKSPFSRVPRLPAYPRTGNLFECISVFTSNNGARYHQRKFGGASNDFRVIFCVFGVAFLIVR